MTEHCPIRMPGSTVDDVTIEVRLLGDVAVQSDGVPLDVGHARQRCVLAALLVDANRPVTADALIERVWSGRPPQRARPTLSSYLSRLRALLANTEMSLHRTPGGYLLAVEPSVVDLYLFRALAAAGRHDEALRLWRGAPFGPLDTPWLSEVRIAWEAERFAVELDRNDAVLAAGGYADLLRELPIRADEHPYDERLAGQLMVAWQRAGRRADALRLYERMRRRLAEELGTDPGPALQRLHRRILSEGPAYAPPVPQQLPAAPPAFTGRERELAVLDSLPAVVTVSGTAGVGKTALVVHWAHRAAARFPDGRLYADLHGFDPRGTAADPARVLRDFLDGLGVPPSRIPDGTQAQVALYRSALSGRRMLIVLDNAADAGQVRPLLPSAPGCCVVVTSRLRLTGLAALDGARDLPLDLPTEEEAYTLLAARIGTARLAADPIAAREAIARCARLPLALALTAARAAAHPEFPLATITAGLDTLSGTPRTVFSWSYRALSPGAARMFRLFGAIPSPDVGVSTMASVAGLPLARARVLLDELAEAHLLTEPQPGRYTCHDLLRAYAAELSGETDRRTAAHRLLDHLLHTARDATAAIHGPWLSLELPAPLPGVRPEPITGEQAAARWFSTELAVLLAAGEHAARHGFATYAWRLGSTVACFLELQGRLTDWAAVQRIALEVVTDHTGQAHAEYGLGRALAALGDYEEARDHLCRAATGYAALGDRRGQARTDHQLGVVSSRLGRDHEAVTHTRRALARYRATGDRHGEASMLNNLGRSLARLGDHHRALVSCEQALVLTRELGDRCGQATAWDSLGHLSHRLGRPGAARHCYRTALRLYRELGGRSYYEAQVLTHLGDLDDDDPIALWQEALDILDGLGHPDATGVRSRLERHRTFRPTVP